MRCKTNNSYSPVGASGEDCRPPMAHPDRHPCDGGVGAILFRGRGGDLLRSIHTPDWWQKRKAHRESTTIEENEVNRSWELSELSRKVIIYAGFALRKVILSKCREIYTPSLFGGT